MKAKPWEWAALIGSALLFCTLAVRAVVLFLPRKSATAQPSASVADAGTREKSGLERDKEESERVSNLPKRCEIRRDDAPDKPAPMFEREADFDEFVSAGVNRDNYGMREAMVRSGFVVQPGTRCLVIDPGFTASRLRVLSGPHTGRSGWLVNEWWSEQ